MVRFKKLKARILERFGSQTDFALFIKTRDSRVSMILHGRLQLRSEEVPVWCKALKVKKEFLSPVTQAEEIAI